MKDAPRLNLYWFTLTDTLLPVDLEDLGTLYDELSPGSHTVLTVADIRETCVVSRLLIGRDPATNRIVAMGTLMQVRRMKYWFGYVHDVVVRGTYQGRGYGRDLMTMILERAREERLHSLRLTSNDRRDVALALYRSMGFVDDETNSLLLALTA